MAVHGEGRKAGQLAPKKDPRGEDIFESSHWSLEPAILLFDSTRFAEVEAACRMWYEILRGPPLAEKFA